MLPKAVVGFSVANLEYYYTMLAWQGKERIDFHFTDCRLAQEHKLEDEKYIKNLARQRIGTTEKYVLLIGEDTRFHDYVRWEAEVAIKKGCTIIGVNLDSIRQIVESKCPAVLMDIGAVFLPFSPRILAYALVNFRKREQGNWHFPDDVYRQLGNPV